MRSPTPTRKRTVSTSAAGRALLLLLFLLTPALGTVLAQGSTEEPVVSVDRYRVDVGNVRPGDTRTTTLTLRNDGGAEAFVRLRQEGSDVHVTLSENELRLAPGESRAVGFLYTTPATAAPGHHGESVRIEWGATHVATPGGSLDAGTAIIVTSRIAALGVLGIEAPATILPGAPIGGRVLVVNTLDANASASPVIALVHLGTGHVALEARPAPREIRAGGSEGFAFGWNATTLAPGAYELRARLDAAPNASRAEISQPFVIGLKRGVLEFGALEDSGDGDARASVTLRNEGTVPLTFHPRLRFVSQATGDVILIDMEAVTLAPGEQRMVTALTRLPAGEFLASVEERQNAEGVETVVAEPQRLSIAAPGASGMLAWTQDDGVWATIALVAGIVLLVALVLLLAPRVLARLRERRAAAAAAARAPTFVRRVPVISFDAPSHEENLDRELQQVLASLAHAQPLALHVDAGSLYGAPGAALFPVDLAGLAHALGIAPSECVAHATAPDARAAELARHAIERQGFVARVSIPRDGDDHRVQLATDTLRALDRGLHVVLATHDEALIEVVRYARDRRLPLALAAVEGMAPPRLLQAAAEVRLLHGNGSAPSAAQAISRKP